MSPGLQPHMLTPPLESFWDSIPRPFLTSHALKELNRRNSKHTHKADGSPRCYGIDVGDIATSHQLLKGIDPELQRFARHGGPDLVDTRGVSPLKNCTERMLIKAPSTQT